MKIVFRKKAVNDILLASEWYKTISFDLENDFLSQLKSSIARIEKNPEIGNSYLARAKTIWLDRFPYSVVYSLYEDRQLIVIIGVFHNRKHPNSKFSRI